MKHIIFVRLTSITILLSVFLAFVASCKKGSDEPAQPVDPDMGTLAFHLHTYLENNEVDAYGNIYTTDAGRKETLDLAQFYLSNIQLVKSDGSIYDVADKKVLKVFDKETYILGDVPVGDYKSVRFHIGFSDADNQQDPSTDEALLNHPEMWFGTTAQPDGYIFLHVKGTIDTTADASGTYAQMQPFEYKLGTSASYSEISMPEKLFTIEKGDITYVHMVADYNRLFDGVSLSHPGNLSVLTVADNASAIATRVAQNLSVLFRYEDN